MKEIPKILKGLFSSKIRIKILQHFLSHSNDPFYPRQLEKILEEPVGVIGRELLNLKNIGILYSQKNGRQTLYRTNRELPFFEELRIFFIKATTGDAIKKVLSSEKDIELAFIFGSFANGDEQASSDIDVMIVGDISEKGINVPLSETEYEIKRSVNYLLYDRKEVKERLKKNDNFIVTVFTGPRILLIGNENDELFRTGERQEN